MDAIIKKYGDIISGISILIFSIAVYFNTYTFQMITVGKIGSDFMPKLVAILMAVLSIFVTLNGVKALKLQLNEANGKGASTNGKTDRFSVIISFLVISVYIAFLEKIGFLIMTALYVFIQILILSQQSQKRYLYFGVVSALVSVVIYFVFVYAFKLVLPAGILG